MNTKPTPPSDPLVQALEARTRRTDLVAWGKIAAWAEKFDLSFADLRLLLAVRMHDGPTGVSELADQAGFSLDTAYPTIHSLRDRGYLHEDRRHYSFSERGRELAAILDGAHAEGIQAYVDSLDRDERRQLEEALGIAR
jgi:DNA-binding MarR family transcriptional regulator